MLSRLCSLTKSNDSTKNVAFLLGAGASIPAGYISTDDLTDLILTSNDYWIGSAERTVFSKNCSGSSKTELTILVRRIICWLKDRTQEYFGRRNKHGVKVVNYEDIYYLASQISDDATELQNPGLLPLMDRLKQEMISWPEYKNLRKQDSPCADLIELEDFQLLWEYTRHYIEDIVTHVLRQPANCDRHLQLITAIRQTSGLKLKGIATLAHDTHVEEFLHNQNIPLADGFSPKLADGNWKIWEDHFPENDRIPYLKLHGSVGWRKLTWRVNNISPGPFAIGVNTRTPICPEPNHNTAYESGRWEPADDRPLLLIGTFNKPAKYAWHMMLDVHYRFRKILEDLDKLVVCGYSFGDKAINTQLIFWCSNGGSLVVIDPRCPSSVHENARYAIRQHLLPSRTTFIPEKMEDVCKDLLASILRG